MINNHWVEKETGKPFTPSEDKFGFVYIITNTKNGKAYIGCKQYTIGRTKKKTKWENYTGSSKYLNEDIKKIGKKYFIFEVIAEYKNKRSLRYYEMYYQVKHNDLTTTLEGSDERAFYNAYVGGKFFPPIESYRRGYKHPQFKGRTEFYLDGKRMVVSCLSEWADDNGYDRGAINQIARTAQDGFFNHHKGKRRAFSLNGPLGKITNVRRLDEG